MRVRNCFVGPKVIQALPKPGFVFGVLSFLSNGVLGGISCCSLSPPPGAQLT
jgi:hypothetical protein